MGLIACNDEPIRTWDLRPRKRRVGALLPTRRLFEAKNLAAQNPEKLKELQALWWEEAERNKALPLLGGLSVFFGILPPMPTITRFAFAGDVQNVQHGLIPRISGRSYAIEAELNVPDGGAEGVILANADFIGGFGLWVTTKGCSITPTRSWA